MLLIVALAEASKLSWRHMLNHHKLPAELVSCSDTKSSSGAFGFPYGQIYIDINSHRRKNLKLLIMYFKMSFFIHHESVQN